MELSVSSVCSQKAPSNRDPHPADRGPLAGDTCRADLLTCMRAVQQLNSNLARGQSNEPRRRQIQQASLEAMQEESDVNKSIRWRIISLQAMLVLILAGASGFLFYEGSFVTSMVKDELTAQQVFFPTADQIKAGGALDPAEFPQEIRDQAGNQITDGNQARIYAQDFLGKHLQTVAGGSTYASIGTKISAANAALAAASKTDPNYATLQANVATLNGQKTTLFTGEMLRATLLNSWGWWTLGQYTTYAGIGLLIAALGVLGAVAFELFIAVRKPESFKVKVGQKVVA